MILLAVVLVTFLQGSLLPINLLLILLIARTFVSDDRKNFYLAFFLGLLLALLLGKPLGSLSLIYLLLLIIVKLIKRTPLSSHWLTIIPLSLIFITLGRFLEYIVFRTGLDFKLIFFETILVLPIYFIVMFWEERFVPRKDIRLKVGK